MKTHIEMARQMAENDGFIAALDQSGGSTPRALRNYGIADGSWADDAEMFALIHQMRTRIIKSPAFSGDKVIGAILFERTMDGLVDGIPTAQYLWEKCAIVPFLKVDKGLEDEVDGVQMMKPMPQLDALCDKARGHGIFGTKMRSTINAANRAGIAANVIQQFEVGQQIIANGLVPILEPEINITIADKAQAEDILLEELIKGLDALADDQQVMLKVSLPETANHYLPAIEHPRAMRVVALSGGYSRDDSNVMLAQNHGMIASFSRGLSEGLSIHQSDDEFNAVLGAAIDDIYRASVAG